jgi:hypothetical protein
MLDHEDRSRQIRRQTAADPHQRINAAGRPAYDDDIAASHADILLFEPSIGPSRRRVVRTSQ